jgi:hypothetical protein
MTSDADRRSFAGGRFGSALSHKEPEWPVLETVKPPDGMRFWSTSGGKSFRMEPPSAAARARADEIIAAHDRWHAKHWPDVRRLASSRAHCSMVICEPLALASTNRTRARPGRRQNGFQVDWGVNFK